jgi:hypothetical protein
VDVFAHPTSGDVEDPDSPLRVSTDAEGRFELRGLTQAPHVLRVVRKDFEVHSKTVQPGDGPVTVVLQPTPKVRGRVVDEDGRPVTGFSISGKSYESPEGEFSLRALPEERTLTVTAPGFAPEHLTVPEGVNTAPLRVVLHEGHRVQGQVVDGLTGQPIAGAAVQMLLGPRESPDTLDARTDPRGAFTLEHAPGESWLRVEAPGHAPATQPLPSGASSVTVQLLPKSTLYGQVEAPGIPPTQLELDFTGPSHESTHPHEDGSYEATDLDPGEYRVTLVQSRPDLEEETSPVSLESVRITVPPGSRVRVDLQATHRGFTGRVRLVPSTPGNNPRALLIRGDVPESTRWAQLVEHLNHSLAEVSTPTSRSDGLLSFEHLEPGRYTLLVMSDMEHERFLLKPLDFSGPEQVFEVQLPPAPPQGRTSASFAPEVP